MVSPSRLLATFIWILHWYFLLQRLHGCNEENVHKYVTDRELILGPWFAKLMLADEICVKGMSINQIQIMTVGCGMRIQQQIWWDTDNCPCFLSITWLLRGVSVFFTVCYMLKQISFSVSRQGVQETYCFQLGLYVPLPFPVQDLKVADGFQPYNTRVIFGGTGFAFWGKCTLAHFWCRAISQNYL